MRVDIRDEIVANVSRRIDEAVVAFVSGLDCDRQLVNLALSQRLSNGRLIAVVDAVSVGEAVMMIHPVMGAASSETLSKRDYFNSMSDAWLLVEAMIAAGWVVDIKRVGDNWMCLLCLDGDMTIGSLCSTAQEAICWTYLKKLEG